MGRPIYEINLILDWNNIFFSYKCSREKLKAEGVKYWKCFADGQDKELKCMKKIVDGFKKQGEKYSARMGGSSMNKKMEDLIKNVTDQ